MMKDFEVLMISVEWESRDKYLSITKSARPLKPTIKPANINTYEYDIVLYTQEDGKYFQFCVKTPHTPFLKGSEGKYHESLFNLKDDLWIIKREWEIGQRGIGYHHCPSINTIGQIEIGILDNFISIDINSNILDFDFEQLKNDFEGELWNLITSQKSKITSSRLELKYYDKIFRYSESKSIIDFLKAYDAIETKPKSELLTSKGIAKIEKVKPIAETYRKLVSIGGSARVLPSKTFIENYDIYENRYLCLMLNSIYKIVSNNINYTSKQLESLEFKINDKKAKIKVLNDPNPQVNQEEIIEEILLQEKKVQNMEEEWQNISRNMPFDSQQKFYTLSIYIKYKHKKSNSGFWCKTDKTPFCLINFPYACLNYLEEEQKYTFEFSFIKDRDIRVDKGKTYPQFTITGIKKIEPYLIEVEKNILNQRLNNKQKLESNNWVQILTQKDIKERENQVKTLENDIKKFEKQIKDLDEFVKEQQKLLPLIEQRIRKTFFKTIKWQNIQGFTSSMTFIQNISYRNALNSYKEILKSEGIDLEVFDLYEKATTYGMREIPQIYELWCLVSIIKTLKEPYGFQYKSQDIRTLLKVINPENNNLNNQVTINFTGNLNGRTITLYYQKTLPNNKRPDFILEISINDRKIYLVLDAKFKNYNYKKSLNYEIKNLNDKYSDTDYYVFILHPCNDLTGEKKPVKMTNHGGDKIYFGEEEDQKPTFPFHKYGYITHKPNFTDNLKKLIGMAFEYLLESNKNANNGTTKDPKPTNDLFCLNCGSTSVDLHPKQDAKKYTADCRTCGHQTHINYCWNCSTKLFKHGYYWDYHKTSVWSSFDIHCPNCGMAFADKP
ncbi:MAG: nuclease domain-containing protein [Dolichospermum sp.]|jgi:DNA-directed RNA polymerase subunit RPC12/RpoP/cell division protein FtsB